MSSEFFITLKSIVLNSTAKLLATSYYLTQIARRVVQIYDNDCNPDIRINGELLLIKLIVARRRSVFFLMWGQIRGTGRLKFLAKDLRGK